MLDQLIFFLEEALIFADFDEFLSSKSESLLYFGILKPISLSPPFEGSQVGFDALNSPSHLIQCKIKRELP
jgi:hypothetical protein